jgi:hypothetical protein
LQHGPGNRSDLAHVPAIDMLPPAGLAQARPRSQSYDHRGCRSCRAGRSDLAHVPEVAVTAGAVAQPVATGVPNLIVPAPAARIETRGLAAVMANHNRWTDLV